MLLVHGRSTRENFWLLTTAPYPTWIGSIMSRRCWAVSGENKSSLPVSLVWLRS
jgi:hypothetical protein